MEMDSLELKFRVFISCPMLVMATEPESSVGAECCYMLNRYLLVSNLDLFVLLYLGNVSSCHCLVSQWANTQYFTHCIIHKGFFYCADT